MTITDPFNKPRAAAVSVVSLIRRHNRASIAVAAVLLIAGPLLTSTGGETFVLNLAGLGIVALVVRQIFNARERRRAAQANGRGHCHWRRQRHQPMANPQR